ncbi:MAG TPA: hypothetical protein VD999_02480 [Vitreimonas sp.]|nr:hypothetical protein [Vitreimonas sp.]
MKKSVLIALSILLNFLAMLLPSQILAASPMGSNPPADALRDFDKVDKATLDALNPLKFMNSPVANELSTPGGFISRFLLFAFPIAGLILFVMIVWGGFEMLSGAASKKSIDSGRQRITAAILGFMMLFCAYWIMQIVEIILGVTIF